MEVMPGLWELPNVPWSRSRREREQRLASRYGGKWSLGPVELEVRHTVTYRAMTLHVLSGSLEWGGTVAEGPEARWIEEEERSRFAMSSMVAKVLAAQGD
jgi:adenine-specific DNA glycosylase